MTKNAVPYTSLPGRHRKFFTPTGDGAYQRAFLGPDHLLILQRGSMTERHRKLYFNDIQSITIHATNINRYKILVTGGLSLTSLVVLSVYLTNPAAATSANAFFIVLLAAAAGIPGFVAATNILLGPSCLCTIHTAVQREDLFCLYRLRAARRFIERVSPHIEKAQGVLSAEDIQSKTASLQTVVASQYASPKSSLKQHTRHEHGKYHVATFVLLLLGSISALIDVVYMSDAKNLIDAAFYSVLVIVNILAIVRQKNSDMPKDVRAVAWSTMIFNGVNFTFMAGLISIVAAIRSVDLRPEEFADFVMSSDSSVFTGYLVVIAIAQAILGAAGLILLQRFRNAYRESVVTPSGPAEPEGLA